jgi:hypothetical protein
MKKALNLDLKHIPTFPFALNIRRLNVPRGTIRRALFVLLWDFYFNGKKA